MTDVIQARGLVKRYGAVTALDGLDLTVPEGTVLGLLGPNGAGKTTAVRVLTTLLTADEGSATVAGVAALTAAVGAALTALFVRRSARPARLVLVLVAVGLLLFAANPVLAADQALTVVALEVMHLAVAGAFLAVVLPALRHRP